MTDARETQRRQAGERAVALVHSGMVVGLGSGATASHATRKLGEQIRAGHLRDIVGVPTSRTTEALARQVGIPLGALDDHPAIDLTIDGADEVDPELNLIKGAGGALLREKMLAQASARLVIVVDASKLSARLGVRSALPVEVIPFGWPSQKRFLEQLGAKVELRVGPDGEPFRTDNSNLILDCRLDPLPQLETLSAQLHMRAGIVEHGLFIGLASDLIRAGDDGVHHETRQDLTTRRNG